MREVNLDAGIFCQYRMLSHFTTLVIRERAAQVYIKALQDRTKALCGRLRSAVVKLIPAQRLLRSTKVPTWERLLAALM